MAVKKASTEKVAAEKKEAVKPAAAKAEKPAAKAEKPAAKGYRESGRTAGEQKHRGKSQREDHGKQWAQRTGRL